MIVIPAIDLRCGKCVRLTQGDYNRETIFDDDPVAVARRWETDGASLLHVVDLEGARDGVPRQKDTIVEIVQALSIPVQVGGGIRTIEHADSLLRAGVSRIVLGTAAVNDPDLVLSLLSRHGPNRIVVGVDARDGMVATQGWLETSTLDALDLIARMADAGVERVVYTDIERDGMLSSPNFGAVREAAGQGVAIIASGGVSRREDLERLAGISGVEATIVGRALYTGDVVLKPGEWTMSDGSGANQIGSA